MKRGKHARHAKEADVTAMPDAPRELGRDSAEPASPAAEPAGSHGAHAADSAADAALMNPVDVSAALAARRKRSGARVAALVMGALAGIVAVAYLAGAVAFWHWFPPGTTLGPLDVSLKSPDEAARIIDAGASRYTVKVTGGGFSYQADSALIGAQIDAAALVARMHERLNPFAWPMLLAKPHHDMSDLLTASYNASGLSDSVTKAVEAFNEKAQAPVSAQVAYDSATSSFQVRKERFGTALNVDAVLELVDHAIVSMQPVARITEGQLQAPAVSADDERVSSARDEANAMLRADVRVTIDGDEVARVNADKVAAWVSIDDDYQVSLDEDGLRSDMEAAFAPYNTVGATRTYTRPDGRTFTVSGGVYGWSVDSDKAVEDVLAAVREGSVTEVAVGFASKGAQPSVNGGPDWGDRYVDVDLGAQHATFYDGGRVIWESDIVSGEPDGVHYTPTGVWWTNRKASPTTLNGYEGDKKIYSTEVSYWMPFQGNAIGFHDAPWQAAFGGTRYRDGFGSHGCVNLPPAAARDLYAVLQEGDCVVVHG
ncbi:L,D-transpeptidase family protein [Berryella wangjianweii]|uniref:L,D-transpeptidase family protein n=1 Tax=Berryella wangjianweii TaxID=2734634 RepID=A0A6M8J5F4_9ACTN|nr:L,D-transpeptidase family protein [Berryella wangjianweii]QKF06719.1 L,D-transpeptidase family protein [Berryella wangjianweii]